MSEIGVSPTASIVDRRDLFPTGTDHNDYRLERLGLGLCFRLLGLKFDRLLSARQAI